MSKAQAGLPPMERFWLGVERGAPDACWPWVGAEGRDRRGDYGALSVDGRVTPAHRYSYELHHGAIPAGQVVRHKCDNPPCCNPAHLILGTKLDNARDREERGRSVVLRGERNGRAKLTAARALAIWSSTEACGVLADRYGVTRRIIYLIKRGQLWSSVTGGAAPTVRAAVEAGAPTRGLFAANPITEAA